MLTRNFNPGAFAQYERALIRKSQREGIVLAKNGGRHLGRAKALTTKQVDVLRTEAAKGGSKQALAIKHAVSVARRCTAYCKRHRFGLSDSRVPPFAEAHCCDYCCNPGNFGT